MLITKLDLRAIGMISPEGSSFIQTYSLHLLFNIGFLLDGMEAPMFDSAPSVARERVPRRSRLY